MRHCLILLTLLFSIYPSAVRAKEANTMIELHARCLNDVQCHFSGQKTEIELEIFNAGREAVSLPTEYYRLRGPVLTLIDNRSGKRRPLRMGPPRSELLEQMQVLEPGQSFRFRWVIMPTQILRFALRPVDVTAEFGLSLDTRLTGENAQMIETTLRIASDPTGR